MARPSSCRWCSQAYAVAIDMRHGRAAGVGPPAFETAVERDHDERTTGLQDEIERLVGLRRVELIRRLLVLEMAGMRQVENRLVRRVTACRQEQLHVEPGLVVAGVIETARATGGFVDFSVSTTGSRLDGEY